MCRIGVKLEAMHLRIGLFALVNLKPKISSFNLLCLNFFAATKTDSRIDALVRYFKTLLLFNEG